MLKNAVSNVFKSSRSTSLLSEAFNPEGCHFDNEIFLDIPDFSHFIFEYLKYI